MDYSFIAFVLLALAAGLLVAEIFIPSAGLLGLGMLACLAISLYFAWLAWFDHPLALVGFVSFAIVFLPGVAVAALSWLPHTRFGKRILLEAPSEQEVLPFAREIQQLQALVGKQAKTLTPLTPGGLITINRQRLHAFTEGLIIERDMPVEIVRVSGTRLVVREISPGKIRDEQKAAWDSNGDSQKQEPEKPLDFEYPGA